MVKIEWLIGLNVKVFRTGTNDVIYRGDVVNVDNKEGNIYVRVVKDDELVVLKVDKYNFGLDY